MSSNDSDNTEITDQDLLEYLFDCHEEPERLKAALADSPELRARLGAARSTQGLLASAAADDSVGPLALEPPLAARPVPILRIAALFAATLIGAPWAFHAYTNARLERLEELHYQVRVEGLASVPGGVERSLELTSVNVGGQPAETAFSWKAFDETGRVVAEDQATSTERVIANVPASLVDLRRIEVTASRPHLATAEPRTVEMKLSGTALPPLVHLTTDKPLYRPGETVYLRAVLLDRLTNQPLDGRFRLRVKDPKDVALTSWSATAEDGVVAGAWFVPPGAAGGRYHLELRSGDGSFAYERLGLEIRRFETPLLAKTVTLSRRTFAPGEEGAASVSVDRMAGGGAAGAEVKATVLVDGERVWGEDAVVDERGRAGFVFDLPDEVERGEGRFVARVRLGGVIETVVEPFVIPVDEISAQVYPESGALITGVPGRVYFEVADASGRPVSASGWVVNSGGARVGDFQTEHLGRGRFELTPEAGESYFLEFEVPVSPVSVPIPVAAETGASLRAEKDDFDAEEPVAATVQVEGAAPDEPWTVGLFCRGQLVAQAEGRGPESESIELMPAENVGGVLRMTLFDRDLQPLAERLVHRTSGQRIEISVTPSAERTLPGEHQVLDVLARDEEGRPVAAVLGLTVTDRAVREEAGVARVGLADQVGLFGDLEWDGPALEERGELLRGLDVDAEEHAKRVDLLLGTRGWRRFAWVDRDACIAAFGDAGRRLLAREGYADGPSVALEAAATFKARRDGVRAASRRAREAKDMALRMTVFMVALAMFIVIWRLLYKWLRATGKRLGSDRGVAAGVLATVLTLAVGASGVAVLQQSMPMVSFGRDGVTASLEAPVEESEDAGSWGALEEGGLGLVEASRSRGFDVPSLSQEMRQVLYGLKSDLGAMGYSLGAPNASDLRRVRVHAHQSNSGARPGDVREDFSETVYWNALLRTSADGRARVEFDVSDRPTTWQILTDAHGAGRVGQGVGSFVSTPVARMEARLPVELTQGDQIQIPVAVTVEGESGEGENARALVGAALDGPVKANGELPSFVPLVNGQGRVLIPVVAELTSSRTNARVAIAIDADGFKDSVLREIRVVPRGFPQRVSKSGRVGGAGQSSASEEFVLAVPDAPVTGSLRFELKVYPSPVADLLDGADGMLQIPHGCFEQASATNYPNVLALSFLDATGVSAPAVRARGQSMLERGYELLTGYECSRLGFEWFGQDPGHEVLSAYGLLQFTDMAEVFDVKPEMVKRTSNWLLGRRDGNGGFELDPKSLDSFGRAPEAITNAYCTYALAVAGVPVADLEVELDRQAARAVESSDPYEVAAASCALAEAGRTAAAETGRERLKTMQAGDGHLQGTTSSITLSGDRDLVVETTAFAVLAWLSDSKDLAHVDRAIQFLLTQRQGSGRFGSTQATVMALRAITMYARQNRTAARAGEIIVYVNDYEVKRVSFEEGAMEAIKIEGLVGSLTPGVHRVRLELTNGNQFPWAADLSYFAEVPADAPDAAVDLAVALDRASCTEGDSVGLDLTVTNLTAAGQPMTMAIVGLPAGLECPTRILDDLKEAGRFDLWERNGREVILYWRDLAPRAVLSVHLDLVATIPGITTGPASRCYLYYTPDQTRWAEPLSIEVEPLR